jgi:dipeptidase D
MLKGHLLINLDTEAWGEVYLGCAGGLDVDVRRDCRVEPIPEGYSLYRLALTGLRGGHSGVDIHEDRGNAIKLLVRVLQGLSSRVLSSSAPFRLVSLAGGTARNALPREAFATLALPVVEARRVAEALSNWQSLLCDELDGVEQGIALTLSPGEPGSPAIQGLIPGEQVALLAALHAAPHGVRRMSRALPGVVETSNNLGIVALTEGRFHAKFMVRSLRDSGSRALGDEIASLFSLIGASVERSGHYPGWQPRPAAGLLALYHRTHLAEFGFRAREQVIHAGLECGIIGARYPELEMISFGPTIHGAHAPGERVEIATVGHCWRMLKALLANIPAPG